MIFVWYYIVFDELSNFCVKKIIIRNQEAMFCFHLELFPYTFKPQNIYSRLLYNEFIFFLNWFTFETQKIHLRVSSYWQQSYANNVG